MLHHDPAAKTHDRIGFTLSMAIALHVAVILGVGFAMQLPQAPQATRMDITLSSHQTDQTIIDADYVAQTNQEASGSESRKKELTTTHLAEVNSASINQIQPEIQIPNQQKDKQRMQVVTADADSLRQAQKVQLDTEIDHELDLQGQQEQLLRQIEIASLQAKLDEEQQTYARLPRIRRTTSVATKAAEDAEYLYRWQQRIETIGNEHYPKQAKEQKLYGDVQVLVAINSDGHLREAKILTSSGIKVLDDAALRIVRLSSPFQPFPEAIRETTDVMEIVRTWQFRKDRFSQLK